MLRYFAFDPTSRKLWCVKKVEKAEGREFALLMSDDVSYRKKLLGL